MGGEKISEYFEGFEIGIKVVNLEKARGEEGEIGVLARDLNNPDPYTMESDVFQYAAENYKIKNGGREKMREMVEDMELEKLKPVFEDYGKRLRAEGLKEGKAEGEKKARIEVAKNMIKMNILTYDKIAEASKISVTEVRNLASSMA